MMTFGKAGGLKNAHESQTRSARLPDEAGVEPRQVPKLFNLFRVVSLSVIHPPIKLGVTNIESSGFGKTLTFTGMTDVHTQEMWSYNTNQNYGQLFQIKS